METRAREDLEGDRSELPAGAAPLVDLAAKWMVRAGLVGRLEGTSIEFTFGEGGDVRSYYVKTKGGRRDLLPLVPEAP